MYSGHLLQVQYSMSSWMFVAIKLAMRHECDVFVYRALWHGQMISKPFYWTVHCTNAVNLSFFDFC